MDILLSDEEIKKARRLTREQMAACVEVANKQKERTRPDWPDYGKDTCQAVLQRATQAEAESNIAKAQLRRVAVWVEEHTQETTIGSSFPSTRRRTFVAGAWKELRKAAGMEE